MGLRRRLGRQGLLASAPAGVSDDKVALAILDHATPALALSRRIPVWGDAPSSDERPKLVHDLQRGEFEFVNQNFGKCLGVLSGDPQSAADHLVLEACDLLGCSRAAASHNHK